MEIKVPQSCSSERWCWTESTAAKLEVANGPRKAEGCRQSTRGGDLCSGLADGRRLKDFLRNDERIVSRLQAVLSFLSAITRSFTPLDRCNSHATICNRLHSLANEAISHRIVKLAITTSQSRRRRDTFGWKDHVATLRHVAIHRETFIKSFQSSANDITFDLFPPATQPHIRAPSPPGPSAYQRQT